MTRFDSVSERDIVLLFGAGASHGANCVQPHAPPLGSGLYDCLAERYKNDWGSESHLGKMWGRQFRNDFERTMFEEVLPNIPSLSLLEWHRPVATFFAGFRLDGSRQDMYSQLLSGLRTKSLLGRLTLGSLKVYRRQSGR
jgi:hypothetical protein